MKEREMEIEKTSRPQKWVKKNRDEERREKRRGETEESRVKKGEPGRDIGS